MQKTETEKEFEQLVSKVIWPRFKLLGYKKAGNNFRYYNERGGFGKIVSFQKSRLYDKDHIHFTVNIGLYLAEFESYFPFPTTPGPAFCETSCAIRRRIGELMNKSDIWYDINPAMDTTSLQEHLERDFANAVIPYLNKIKTRDDVIDQIMLDNSNYGFLLIAQIKTLYCNGQEERARNLLTQSYRGATEGMKESLEDLKRELSQ